jgi:hypothetical protein
MGKPQFRFLDNPEFTNAFKRGMKREQVQLRAEIIAFLLAF